MATARPKSKSGVKWKPAKHTPLKEVLKTMRDRTAKFNVEKVRQEDVASADGAPDE